MNRKGGAMALLTVVCVVAAMACVGGRSWKEGPARFGLPTADSDKIAVVPIYGELVSPDFVVQLLHRYRDEVKGVKAVVLAIDSPGGGVATAQEIVEAVKDLQDSGIYVVAAMGSVAASGGYYIAAPCDRIVANPGTLTGSIGVIMETMNAKKILDKVGLDYQVVKSGEFKDAGSFSRPLSARERNLFQGVINDVYGQFLDIVSEERKAQIRTILARKRNVAEQAVSDVDIRNYVKSYADGRVFSGRMAQEYGLVDELGGLDRAVRAAAEIAGLKNPEVVTYKEGKTLAELLTGVSKADLRSWAQLALGATSRKFGFYAW
jgi:protease-4